MNAGQYARIRSAGWKNWVVRAYMDSRFGVNQQNWCDWVFGQIAFPACAKVLELGCGAAGLWKHNAFRVPEDAAVTLSDFSKRTLIRARQALGPRQRRYKFLLVNAEQIPFSDALFDIVIANRVLYFTDLKKALCEIGRVLKPGGRLYAATVGIGNMREILELYFEFFSIQNRDRKTVADIFGLDNGTEILQEYFDRVEVRRFASELFVTESLPLVDYIRTAQDIDKSHLTPGGARGFRRHLNGIIHREGHIKVTKDMGLLIAEK